VHSFRALVLLAERHRDAVLTALSPVLRAHADTPAPERASV
jgi:hypothetical protein